MDLATVRQIVNASPHGVVIRMVDGTRLRLPHRECVTLGPPLEDRPPDAPHRNMFVAADDEGFHFIDAGDVAGIDPILKRTPKRGNATAVRRKSAKKKSTPRAAKKGRK